MGIRFNGIRVAFVMWALGTFVLSACGGTVDFVAGNIPGQAPKSQNSEQVKNVPGPTPVPTPTPEPTLPPVVPVPEDGSMLWFWQCPTAPVALPPGETDEEIVIEGSDSQVVSIENMGKLTIRTAGRFCDPVVVRDVVFVVDVSDSMRNALNFGNDPVKNNSCGRLDSVKLVLSKLDSSSRVQFVTFDRNVKRFSSSWLSPADFLAQHANVDVMCEQGASTNYTKALTKTAEILTTALPNASREVYFVSDGQPGDADGGRTVAAQIRKTATIATLLLKGNDTVLEELASKDEAGKPLHSKVSNADDLAEALAAFLVSYLAEVRMSLSSESKELWSRTSEISGSSMDFAGEQLVIDPLEYPAGVVFSYQYYDNLGRHWGRSGEIVWH